MTAPVFAKCKECNLASDRVWKSYKHPQFGAVWEQYEVCRHCWQSVMYKMEAAARKEEAKI